MNTSKLLINYSMATLTFVSVHAYAQQQINETLDANADGIVEIEHLNGKAKIIGWDKNQVKVEGELGERTKEFTFERKGNSIHLIVEVENQKGWGNWGDYDGDDLLIHVPKQSTLDYTSVNADVSAKEISGSIDIEVVNGDVSVSDMDGKIRLEAVNGDITAQNMTGDLRVETVNGDIKTKHLQATDLSLGTVNGDIQGTSDSPRLRAESVNGDIELELVSVDDAETSTVNGTIELDLHLNEGADLRASSVGGSINLTFQNNVSARFDIEAHAGGSIKNRITQDKMEKAEFGPRRWLEFETGNASAQVDISTVHGRVRLDKE